MQLRIRFTVSVPGALTDARAARAARKLLLYTAAELIRASAREEEEAEAAEADEGSGQR